MLCFKLVPFHFQELNFLPACGGLPFCMLLMRAFVVHEKEFTWNLVLNRLPTHLLPTDAVRIKIKWPPLVTTHCLSAWVSGGWSD